STPRTTTQTRVPAAQPPDPARATPDLGAPTSAAASSPRRRGELRGSRVPAPTRASGGKGKGPAAAFPAGRASCRRPARAAARREEAREGWWRLGFEAARPPARERPERRRILVFSYGLRYWQSPEL